jgi:RNA polymerase sigma factor (sigma-70 family)
LYEQFSVRVYNIAIGYMQNSNDAEEVTQDVFTSVFRNAIKFKGDSNVGTWIYRITVNTSLNHINKRKRNVSVDLGEKEIVQPDFNHPGVILENKENARYLFGAIDKLPKNQKTAFILSYIDDLPRQIVADTMEMSLKAIESLLQRGKKNLRDELRKMYPNRRKKK